MAVEGNFFPVVVMKNGEIYYSRDMYHEYMINILIEKGKLKQTVMLDRFEDKLWTANVFCEPSSVLKITWDGGLLMVKPPWLERELTKYEKIVKKAIKPACVLFRRHSREGWKIYRSYKKGEMSEDEWTKQNSALDRDYFKNLRKLKGYIWEEETDESELES